MKDTNSHQELPSSLTRKDLEEYIIEIFNSRPKERKVVGMRGCITYGAVTMNGDNDKICNDPECASCQMFNEALHEEAKKFLNDYKTKED